MSIQSEIDRIQGNMADAYAAVAAKGGTLPEAQNSSNLAAAVKSIRKSGGGVQVESISIKTGPQSTQYISGDTFDPTGMVVEAAFSNGKSFNVKNSDLAFEPSGSLQIGTEAVTIRFQWGDETVQTEQPIRVFNSFSWWSPQMTSDTAPFPYAASASNVYGDLYQAWNAFDGVPTTDNYGTGGMWYGSDFAANQWIQFDFGHKPVVKGIKINPSYATWGCASPKDFKIVRSDNAVDWADVLEVHSDRPADMGEYDEYLFPENCEFQIYRILCGRNYAGTNTAAFGDIQFFKQDG